MPDVANTDQEILDCFAVMSQLRMHLQKEDFVTTVRAMMADGFRLAYIKESSRIVAVAGFRIYTNLFMGKHLYVDDLVTDEQTRSKGHGRVMLDWLKQFAKENACQVLHLDSGVQRHKAHKFYLNQGFDIVSYHFSQKINGGT